MALDDITKFRLRRINPFQGLVIDADTWQDAHNYHRDQQRLHILAFHRPGIIEGLDVTANSPADLSVNIGPGIAADPEGNVIIVPKSQHYRIQSRAKGVVYLTIEFREIPSEPYQPPEGGQPTRIVEAYRIRESDKLPAEPHLELARIDFDPGAAAVRNAKSPSNPGKNEINLSFRVDAKPGSPTPVLVASQEPVARPAEPTVTPKETIVLGHAVVGDADKSMHSDGLVNLVREVNVRADFEAELETNIRLDKSIRRCAAVFLTGNTRFELSADQQAALGILLEAGGLVFGEGCSEGEAGSRGAKGFGLAFNQLAGQLKRKLEIVQRGHPLLSAMYVFSEVPQGAEAGMLLEGGRMVYSGSDYGCAWQGGHAAAPLSREIIRNSMEMGANILVYCRL